MNKVAITIDENISKVKILFLQNKALDYIEYPIPENFIANEIDYKKIFTLSLNDFSEKTKIYPSTITYVFPNKYAICDYIEMPSFRGKKLNELLNLEMANRYKQSNILKTSFFPIGQKTASVFCAFSLHKNMLDSVIDCLKVFKFTSKHITFEALMTLNAYLDLFSSEKHENVLFSDIKQHTTEVIAINNGSLLGCASLPYGENTILQSDNCSDNLICLLEEFQDILKNKYNMENISIKYNSSNTLQNYINDIIGNKFEKAVIANHIISSNMGLYGAIINCDKGSFYE